MGDSSSTTELFARTCIGLLLLGILAFASPGASTSPGGKYSLTRQVFDLDEVVYGRVLDWVEDHCDDLVEAEPRRFFRQSSPTNRRLGHPRSLWSQIGSFNGLGEGDSLGERLAISNDGKLIVFSAPGYDDSDMGLENVGLAMVWRYDDTLEEWKYEGALTGSAAGEKTGLAVALSGNGKRFAVAYPYRDVDGDEDVGVIKVFEYDGSGWFKVGNDIVGQGQGDFAGFALSMSESGHRIAVGAYGYDKDGVEDSGLASLFEFNGSDAWVWLRGLTGSWKNHQVGYSVGLSGDGNRMIIGAPWTNDPNSFGEGGAYIIEYNESTKKFDTLASYRTPPGEGMFSWMSQHVGYSVSISKDGTVAAIGIPGVDRTQYHYSGIGGDLVDVGAVAILKEMNGSFEVDQTFFQEGEWNCGEERGSSVSLSADGLHVAIGSPGYGKDAGRIEIWDYDINAGEWTLNYLTSAKTKGARFGGMVALNEDGSVIASAAPVGFEGKGDIVIWKRSVAAGKTESILDDEDNNDNNDNDIDIDNDSTVVSGGTLGCTKSCKKSCVLYNECIDMPVGSRARKRCILNCKESCCG